MISSNERLLCSIACSSSLLRSSSRQFSMLKLEDKAFCINIVEQFVESSQESYVVYAQIKICDEE